MDYFAFWTLVGLLFAWFAFRLLRLLHAMLLVLHDIRALAENNRR